MTSSSRAGLSRTGMCLPTLGHVDGDSVIGPPIADIALISEREDETDATVIHHDLPHAATEVLSRWRPAAS